MKTPQLIVAMIALCMGGAAPAQTVKLSEDAESLRQILAHQPNYVATQRKNYYWSSEVGERPHRIAKLGNLLAEITEDTIIIQQRDKPTIKIFPKRKEYAEVLFQDNNDFSDWPELYAAREGLVFKSLGREKVGNYECIKIEASYPNESLKDTKYVFWAAPELKGLVIKTERFYTESASYQMLLQDVSLNVDEAIFKIPAGFKKVIEPEL
jgi:hypothetical protein